MPNRILKESICTSESVDSLSWFEEALFYRLIVNCDDYGRFDARPAVIKARLFPLKERLTSKDVSAALSKLADAGIVKTYVSEGKPYLYLPAWEVHQTIRAQKSRYPAPEDGVLTSESICKQMHADVPVIQSNPNPNTNTNAGKAPAHKYGLYGNVILTDADMEKLKQEFPGDYRARIDRLSEYMKSTGKSYKDHLATIRSWARKDSGSTEAKETGGKVRPSLTLGAAELEAIQRTLKE